MNIIKFLPLISSIFVISIGIFVLSRNIKSKLNILFMLFCLSISIWLFGTYKMFFAKTDEEAISWDRFIYTGVIFIPIFMHHFSIVFGRVKTQGKLLLMGYVLAIAFLLLSRTNYFVKDLYHYRWGCHTIAQPLHHVFLLVFWGYVVLLNYNVFRFYKITKSAVERNQAKYVFLAFMILFVVGACAYLPAYKVPILPFPFLSGVFFTIILGYAIARHRLLDIHFVIRKTLTNIILIILGSGIISTISHPIINYPTRITLGFIIVCFIIIYLPKIKTRIENMISHILYKGKYDYLDRLEKFVEKMVLIPKEEDLIKDTAMVLTRDMYTEKVALLMRDHVTGDYLVRHKINIDITGDIKLLQNSKIVNWLREEKKAFILEEEEKILADSEVATIGKELELFQATVCIPARVDSDLIGIIVLGNKNTGEMYTHVDLELLERLGIQLAVALDYKRVEAELRKKQEFEAIGQMAMETTHEFKNLMVSMKTFLQLLPEKLNDPEFMGHFRRLVEADVDAANRKTEDILFFAQEQKAMFGLNVNINQVIKDDIEPLKIKVDNNRITIKEEFSQNLPLMIVDTGLLKHVFKNLFINAVDAMEDKAGTITFRTSEHPHPSGQMKEISSRWIRIEIEDEGGGIPLHIKEKLFKAFVTTKSVGGMLQKRGVGLGLAIVKKAVDAHRGIINVDSIHGKGTTFIIDLPVTQKL